jgi:hypothetical protein
MLKKFIEAYYSHKIGIMQNSIFYRFSLEKRDNTLNPNKFLTDPWSGNSAIGKDILNSISNKPGFSLDLMENLINNMGNEYAYNFEWIRHLQAVGGNGSMRLTRDLILIFINNYRKMKGFWLHQSSWALPIVGERLINWMFSYSFFASGSNDSFQKIILSSIAEQFSHLWRCYKAELNPQARLIALKAIVACLCSMRNTQFVKIRRIIKEITGITESSLDSSGMIINRNPNDHFNMFKSLIEIRFIFKNSGIELPNRVFIDCLGRMAACIRFLRLGDGEISGHVGDGPLLNSGLAPTRQMIDTALSVVESKNSGPITISGFTRLSTKKIVLIVNTKPCCIRSRFSTPLEPGLNIFDFEASFGLNRMINRADITVLLNGFRIKIRENAKYFSKIKHERGELHFVGEVQQKSRYFNFDMQREITINLSTEGVRGRDFIRASDPFQAFPRFVFDHQTITKEIHSQSILINHKSSEYILSIFQQSQDCEVFIARNLEGNYPTIEIRYSVMDRREASIAWAIEGIS